MSNISNNPISQVNPNEEGVGPELQDASSSPNPFDPEKLALRRKRTLVPDTEPKPKNTTRTEPSQPQTSASRSIAVPARSPETVLERDLAKAAHDINATLEKADKAETRADDLRITAAKMLAEAEKKHVATGRPFKSWVEENIKDRAYTTVMELTAVGRSKDPRQALADMRAEKVLQQRKSRATRSNPRRLGSPDGTFDPTAMAGGLTDEEADLLAQSLNDRHWFPGSTVMAKRINDEIRAAEKAKAKMVEEICAENGYDRQMVIAAIWLFNAEKLRAESFDQDVINCALGTLEYDAEVLEPDAAGIEIVKGVLAEAKEAVEGAAMH